MIDAKMKRTMKWHTEGSYIDTDMAWVVAAKKALKNLDRDSLRLLLNAHYGLLPTQADYMTTFLIWQELQRRNKEEKKMENKKYYSGSVTVTTWKERKTFKGDYIMSNHRSDLITFKDGRYFGVLLDPKTKIMAKIPINLSAGDKRYTKEDIEEAIVTAWDKGEYAEDQTDISWIFNPDPEGFTGMVDLATVLLKDPKGNGGCLDAYYNPQVRARCRVRIVDGTFFEKLGGSSKLADILKNHKGVFTTKEDIVGYIKDKWSVRDFGNDASYFTLDIEEES